MPQLERPTTRIYNYVLGGFGEKKEKNKIFRKKKTLTVRGAGSEEHRFLEGKWYELGVKHPLF